MDRDSMDQSASPDSKRANNMSSRECVRKDNCAFVVTAIYRRGAVLRVEARREMLNVAARRLGVLYHVVMGVLILMLKVFICDCNGNACAVHCRCIRYLHVVGCCKESV